jgi:two-component system, OmpR family, phosphate regulon sensor histidine kinase PhoR
VDAYGALLAGIAALALGGLAYQLVNLRRLRRWLIRPERSMLPEALGAWDRVFGQLYRREREHAQEKRRLRHLVVRSAQAGRALPDGVVILDAANRVEWCNDRAERYLVIDRRVDVRRPILNLVRDPAFVRYVESGAFSSVVNLRPARNPSLALSLQLIPYGQHRKLLLCRDVTQEEMVETMRRDFVANVSHELRTPLTVLSGFLETVRELDLDPERTQNYLALMSGQAERMQRIIEDLLELSSLESAPAAQPHARVPVGPLLTRIRAEAEVLSAGRHRVTLELEGQHDLFGAEAELASAFGNIAGNAIRYTPEGGAVRLIWRGTEDGATFTVEDTGIGIAPEQLPRLTERFYRVDRSRSRETGGTGLGLAIVKHALARHDARLEIESKPGKGSRFSARFPARRLVPAATLS